MEVVTDSWSDFEAFAIIDFKSNGASIWLLELLSSESSEKYTFTSYQLLFVCFLWGVQVWGLLCLARGIQMVFVPDGEQQRYSGGSFHRSVLVSLFHLQPLSAHINIPSAGASDVSAIVFTVRSQANTWTLRQREHRLPMDTEGKLGIWISSGKKKI